MSHNDTGANEPHDDAQTDAQADEQPDTLSLEEAQAAFQHVEQRRETRRYSVPDGQGSTREVEFTVRALQADERDELESIAARQSQKAEQRARSGQTDDMDIWPVKRAQLEYGIVDSNIEGFTPAREDHLKSLPSFVQDDLFNAIDSLGELDREVVEGFQSMG